MMGKNTISKVAAEVANSLVDDVVSVMALKKFNEHCLELDNRLADCLIEALEVERISNVRAQRIADNFIIAMSKKHDILKKEAAAL